MIYSQLIAERTGHAERALARLLKLFDEGATIPFIARYRKEQTEGMDEVQITQVRDLYTHLSELDKRKEFILKTIEEQGLLTDSLRERITACYIAHEIEDLYLPFRPKRKTKAEEARKRGLEPLAKALMRRNMTDVVALAHPFVKGEIAHVEEALQGARDIMAEWINEHEKVRAIVRDCFQRSAVISSKVVKGKEDEGSKYKDYFAWSEPLKRCSSHRLLAMRRGEKEGFLRVSVRPDEELCLQRLVRFFALEEQHPAHEQFAIALKDAYKRLLRPAIELEYARMAREKAEDEAIEVFGKNVMQLLLAPPLGAKRVLAIDPGYRSGCKTVCLGEQGELLHNETVYLLGAGDGSKKQAIRKIVSLVEAYRIDAIAVGNGTGGREAVSIIQHLRYNRKVQVFSVNEDGASIYSASAVAREEFPDYDVTVRGAVSIGRRLMDPLAELVKIDPQSIGVGQYQHDIDQGKMKLALNRVVEHGVNTVGVNVNTASKHLLAHVSGLGAQLAENIVAHRLEHGVFSERKELLKVKRMGAKSYEQCAGFLRIPEGSNPLDNTAVHPESYAVVAAMAKDCKCRVGELIGQEKLRENLDVGSYVSENIGLPTVELILKELKRPGRDPREKIKVMNFDDSIKKIEDLRVGQSTSGIITNITKFGAFVDIGIKENGLIHISNLSDSYVSDPSAIVKINQHVRVKVIGVDLERKRIALSLDSFD